LKNYEFIDHTADIGIRVKGRDLKGLFLNAAEAMFDIIAEPPVSVQGKQIIKTNVDLKADNSEELLVAWLSELLSLSYAKELIFYGFEIKQMDKNSLQAEASGINTEDCEIKTEIKAVTYHELKIEKTGSGWQAQIIFDV